MSKKISRGIGILSKLRHFVTDDIFTQLYYSLVCPFLAYGLVVWGNTYATTLKPVVTLQKQALRIITFSKRDAQSSLIFSQLSLVKRKWLNQIYGSGFYANCRFYVSVSESLSMTFTADGKRQRLPDDDDDDDFCPFIVILKQITQK